MNQIIVGKRIPIGGAVGGVITFAAWVWNVTHPPEMAIPAIVVGGVTTTVIAIVQTIVVNRFGVTVKSTRI